MNDLVPINTLKMLRLAHVPRWTVVPMMRPQTVLEHSWNVGFIAGDLAQIMGLPPGETVAWALAHDCNEAHTGDIPAPAKARRMVEDNLPFVVPQHLAPTIKLADLIDAYTYLTLWGLQTLRRERILDRLRNEITNVLTLFPEPVRQRAIDLIREILEDHYGAEFDDSPEGPQAGPRGGSAGAGSPGPEGGGDGDGGGPAAGVLPFPSRHGADQG